MTRTLLVEGDKTFKINIPDDSKITFGPWSPPTDKEGFRGEGSKRGTLRVYQGTKENIIACFSGVTTFRDITAIDYSEQVVKEEGATVWKNDRNGYEKTSHVSSNNEWVDEPKAIAAPKRKKK